MKTILLAVGIAISVSFLIPLYSSKLNIGSIFGILFGGFLIANGMLMKEALAFYKTKLGIAFLMLFFAAMLLFLVTLAVIIKHSKAQAKNAETLIVLGCRVKGVKPSLALESRCNAAFEYLKQNPSAIAILSGGQGKDEEISEAQCMKNVLISLGINESRLILENKSTNTKENIIFSKEIISSKSLPKSIAIVSSEYHIFRAKMIAKSFDLNVEGLSCNSKRFLRVSFFVREVFAIWQLVIKNLLGKK